MKVCQTHHGTDLISWRYSSLPCSYIVESYTLIFENRHFFVQKFSSDQKRIILVGPQRCSGERSVLYR